MSSCATEAGTLWTNTRVPWLCSGKEKWTVLMRRGGELSTWATSWGKRCGPGLPQGLGYLSGLDLLGVCITFLWLLSPSTTNWWLNTANIYSLTVLGVSSLGLRCQQAGSLGAPRGPFHVCPQLPVLLAVLGIPCSVSSSF